MLHDAALVTAASAVLLGLGMYGQPRIEVSSDGDRYLTMGRGGKVPYPFMFRWLLPAVCGDSMLRWRLCTSAHLLALPAITSLYIGHWVASSDRVVVGSLLMCGFAGIWRNNIRRPVLVDPAALTWALAAAVLSLAGLWAIAVPMVLVAGCLKETAPVFAAAFCLDPVLLVGLLAPVARRLLVKPGGDTHHSKALADPVGWARHKHAPHLFDARVMIAPWGAGVAAVLATQPDIVAILAVSLAAGYGQLITAANTVRLYQWAAPAVALGAATVIPHGWAAAVLLAHLFNPLAGDGR